MLVRRLTLWFGKTYGSRSGKNSGGIDHSADENELHFENGQSGRDEEAL